VEAGNVYRILIGREFEKQVRRQPSYIRSAVDSAISEIQKKPKTGSHIKALSGYEDMYRYRIGNYRMIYRVVDDHLEILMLLFASRGDVYKKLNNRRD